MRAPTHSRSRMRSLNVISLCPSQALGLALCAAAEGWRRSRSGAGCASSSALSQLDAIANEGLRAVEAELTTVAWARNQQIWLRLDQLHNTRMHCEIVDNHGEPLLMSNQELYSVMVQISCTLKTQALANMQVQWRPKSAGKWHPFQWEAILHCPMSEGHIAVPSSVSRIGDCMHVWLAGRADLLRLFQRTLFRQADPVPGDAVRFLYTLLSTPPCERRYA